MLLHRIKKKRASIWLKIAASLLFVAGAATWIWLHSVTADALREHNNSSTLSDASSPVSPPVDKQTTNPGHSKDDHADEKTTAEIIGKRTREANVPEAAAMEKPASKKRAPAPRDHSPSTDRTPAVTNTVRVTNDVAIRKETVAAHQSVITPPSEEYAMSTHAEATSGTNPEALLAGAKSSNTVTLTYSTEDVSAYLNKNLNDDATDEDKKQSTLKKLLQKANDLKSNQDPLAELRQRKNEILALNFMNDKRGQKTRN